MRVRPVQVRGAVRTALCRLLVLLLLVSLVLPPSLSTAQSLGPAATLGGNAMAFGGESFGELGDGGSGGDVRTSPVAVSGLTEVVQIVGGEYPSHTLARRADGTVWAWGNNGNYGALGD